MNTHLAQLSISLSSLQEPQQHKSQNPKFLSPSQSKTNQKFQPLHSNIKLKQHKLQYPIFFSLLFSWKPNKERKLNNGYVLNLKKKEKKSLPTYKDNLEKNLEKLGVWYGCGEIEIVNP